MKAKMSSHANDEISIGVEQIKFHMLKGDN